MSLVSKVFLFYFRSIIVAKKYQPVAEQKECWYGTQYKLESISSDVIQVSFLYHGRKLLSLNQNFQTTNYIYLL